jgi:DNA replication protein DnaC
VENEQDKRALFLAHKFSVDQKGFLFMTGALGDGKSFLAVAILRAIGKGMFITHNDLLFKLRRGYGDRDAEDILESAIESKLLILDDVGMSGGGRDDLPMLHHVLSNRHDGMKPTVITSNLTLAEVYRTLGSRMAQRFAQSFYEHVAFSGQSHRSRERNNYLAQ